MKQNHPPQGRSTGKAGLVTGVPDRRPGRTTVGSDRRPGRGATARRPLVTGNIHREPNVRSLVVRGSRSGKAAPAARRGHIFADPTACERCGAVYTRKVWRRGNLDADLLGRAAWDVCPACRQEATGESFGRVIIRGAFALAQLEEIDRRIRHVAARAEFTQPERRVIDVRPGDGGVEVLTTSQKLAHRIARELEKAFGGRVRYAWSDHDGRLEATWEV